MSEIVGDARSQQQPYTGHGRRIPHRAELAGCLRESVDWTRTVEAQLQWRSQVGQDTWAIRVNDFPEEHLYTLFINGEELGSFDDWPGTWVRAPHPA